MITPNRTQSTDVSSIDSLAQRSTVALPASEETRERQQMWRNTAMMVLIMLCTVGTFGLSRWVPPQELSQSSPRVQNTPQNLFRNWTKPELAIVLSGQQYGYLQPCGCSSPQLGGLTRRFNFVEMLRKQNGWPVVALDLGDIAQSKSPIGQRRLKYRTVMQALNIIGYSAVGVGKNEMDMPLLDALAEFTLQQNVPSPRILAANLANRGPGEFFDKLVDGTFLVQTPGKPTVGVVGLIGPSVQQKVNDPDLKFDKDNAQVILNSLKPMRGKADVVVLVYQGNVEEAKACAAFCADRSDIPRVDVILCLSDESEPPAVSTMLPGQTQMIQVGHKGRYVGVLGVFRTPNAAKPFEFKYELVPISPAYETPAGKELNHPVMQLMEQYAKLVKENNYIVQFPRSKHPMQVAFPQAAFVGSRRCKSCHSHAYEVWERKDAHGLSHSKAYESLVHAKNPGLRQFDGECVKCHVIGFEHPTGYADALRENEPRIIERLQNVGCESCHGPGSEHIKQPENATLHALMNPWKAKPGENAEQTQARMLKIDLFCQTCHDTDNDVHWDFAKKWPKIVHHTPKENAPPAVNQDQAAHAGRRAREEIQTRPNETLQQLIGHRLQPNAR